jgi:hypothetical protein
VRWKPITILIVDWFAHAAAYDLQATRARGRPEKDPGRIIIMPHARSPWSWSRRRSPAAVVNVATPTSTIKMSQSDRVVHPIVDSTAVFKDDIFKNKVLLCTGGGSGICRSMTETVVRFESEVVVCISTDSLSTPFIRCDMVPVPPL